MLSTSPLESPVSTFWNFELQFFLLRLSARVLNLRVQLGGMNLSNSVAEGIWDKVVVKSVRIKDCTFVKNVTGATDNTRKYGRVSQNKKLKPLDLAFVIQTIKRWKETEFKWKWGDSESLTWFKLELLKLERKIRPYFSEREYANLKPRTFNKTSWKKNLSDCRKKKKKKR